MSDESPVIHGRVCPVPLTGGETVQLAHGGGGRRMQELIRERIGPVVGEQACAHDGAVLELGSGRVAMTTDGFVVHPLFFPGGDIGSLAVYGTVNDLAMTGAKPAALSLGLILEEGLPLETLDRVLATIRRCADEAGVRIATGDTKVVDRGKADGLFVTTAGVGVVAEGVDIGPWNVRPGDAVLLSGDVGRHGVAILSVREGLEFEGPVQSDCASLSPAVEALLDAGVEIHCLRDSTRGGMAAGLVEIAGDAGVEIQLSEGDIPVLPTVHAACEILGLSPLHLACEGRFVAFVPEAEAERALEVLRGVEVSAGAVRIGSVHEAKGDGRVWLKSAFGSSRLLDLPSGEQLPRIC
jgi:hydrogenase expression/formation protein HypE